MSYHYILLQDLLGILGKCYAHFWFFTNLQRNGRSRHDRYVSPTHALSNPTK